MTHPRSTRRRRRLIAPLSGALAGSAVLAILAGDLGGLGTRLARAAFDRQMDWLRLPPGEPLVRVVDIDRASLAALGPWPWPRETLARLVESVAAAGPASIGIDIVIAERGPGTATGDAALAEALGKAPTALGAVLDPDTQAPAPRATPLGMIAPMALAPAMTAPGLAGPGGTFLDAANGLGVISLPGAEDGRTRAVPIVAVAGGAPLLALALETIRLAEGDVTVLVDGETRQIRIGRHRIALAADGLQPLILGEPARRAARTLSAAAVIAGSGADALRGRVVLIGASAPEAGGLRATPGDTLIASTQLQADLAEQVLLGIGRERPDFASWSEAGAAILLSGLALAAVTALSPPAAVGILALLVTAWIAAATAAFARGIMIDPLSPTLVAIAAFQGAALTQFALVRRERAAIVRRFSQHLPAAVVARIAEDPGRLRLDGEERVVTALFTDIEGFTAMTDRLGPQELVRLLDTYLERVCSLVVAHGGMVDKVVGDAVHAYFNAPIDLPDHAECALACAEAIIAATETLRLEPACKAAALGRTRIGIETGPAVVGDVGGGRKLDYTAHGRAINLAARLEAANKRFGSSIAVGPGLVAACPGRRFRTLGTIEPFAGSPPVSVSEPILPKAAQAGAG